MTPTELHELSVFVARAVSNDAVPEGWRVIDIEVITEDFAGPAALIVKTYSVTALRDRDHAKLTLSWVKMRDTDVVMTSERWVAGYRRETLSYAKDTE